MKASKIGNTVIWSLALLVIPLCFMTAEDPGMHHRIPPLVRYLNKITAFGAYSLFALTFVLSTRARWLDRYFGGLDKMYQTHHKIALAAFLLMCIHPFLLAVRWVPDHIMRFFMTVFPIHHKLAVNLGSYALWGTVLLMVFTLVIKLPYRSWKISHKFMGIFFILALVHTFQLTVAFAENPALWIYLLFISTLGLSAFIYQVFLYKMLNRGFLCQVSSAEKITGGILHIGLRPLESKICFSPGQFCFFSFRYPAISGETHPYTLLSSGEKAELQVMVKSLGDYTAKLYSTVTPGVKVRLYGPYGGFVFNGDCKNQVWIAGGIGIAPFISWLRYLKQNPPQDVAIELYYCVHKHSDVVFLEELRAFHKSFPKFNSTLICTEERSRFSVREIDKVNEKEFFLCGPGQMCRSIIRDLRKQGVLQAKVHHENFDF